MESFYHNDWNAIAERAGYSVRKLATLSSIPVQRLERGFRKYFHCKPKRWLMRKRLKNARARLARGHRVKIISQDLGFQRIEDFSRLFKRVYKISPSRWRKMHRHSF